MPNIKISPRITSLIIKEILTLFRDPKARIVLIMPPLLQLIIFAYAATLEVTNIELAIYNQDRGAQSQELINRLQGSRFFSYILFLEHEEQIKPVIDEQQATAVIQIPQNFSAQINAGNPVRIQAILDGRRSNASQIVNGYLQQIVRDYNQSLYQNAPDKRVQSIDVISRNWFNPNLYYQWFTVPSLICILSMLVALIITSLSVARERELGTFDQLLVSPLSPGEILLGKTVPAILIGLVEACFIWCAGVWFFQIPYQGSILLMFIVLLVFILSTVGIGLFISSLSATQQQTILGTFVFMVPAVTLSGYASPIENMPGWLQVVTGINPLKYALIAVKGLFLKALPFREVWRNIWPMLIIAGVCLPIAGWYFKRRVE